MRRYLTLVLVNSAQLECQVGDGPARSEHLLSYSQSAESIMPASAWYTNLTLRDQQNQPWDLPPDGVWDRHDLECAGLGNGGIGVLLLPHFSLHTARTYQIEGHLEL